MHFIGIHCLHRSELRLFWWFKMTSNDISLGMTFAECECIHSISAMIQTKEFNLQSILKKYISIRFSVKTTQFLCKFFFIAFKGKGRNVGDQMSFMRGSHPETTFLYLENIEIYLKYWNICKNICKSYQKLKQYIVMEHPMQESQSIQNPHILQTQTYVDSSIWRFSRFMYLSYIPIALYKRQQ